MFFEEEKDIDVVRESDLYQAFKELQIRKTETIRNSLQMNAQTIQLMKKVSHAELMYNEISGLPQSTNVYNTVGRMFVQSDLDEAKRNIDNELEIATVKFINYDNNRQYLEYMTREKTDGLRLMIRRIQERILRKNEMAYEQL